MKAAKNSEAVLKIADLKRPPPAYQTYASDDLAKPAYFRMTLAERGLYDSMLRVQWIEGHVPSDPDEIAELIRRPIKEVHDALASGRVLDVFAKFPGKLINVMLRDQRDQQTERRKAQVEAGMRTAAANKAKQSAQQAAQHAAPEGVERSRAEASHIEERISTITTTSTGSSEPTEVGLLRMQNAALLRRLSEKNSEREGGDVDRSSRAVTNLRDDTPIDEEAVP